MKNENNYTGFKVGSPLSTPTEISLYINGFIIRRIDLWEGNETGKAVRKAYEREKVKLEAFFEEIKTEITAELKEAHPDREIIFDDDLVWSGKSSASWGGDGNSYKGISYYFHRPSPSHADSPLVLIWTFRTEKGNTEN